MSFPDAPVTWDMRVGPGRSRRRRWSGTAPAARPGGTRTRVRVGCRGRRRRCSVVRLDHTGFAAVDDMFRIVTVGWAQMLLSLKAYLESGVRKPFFDF